MIRCLLLDIEDQLFPYIRKKLKTYLETNWALAEVQSDVESLRRQAEADAAMNLVGVPEIAGHNEEKSQIIESLIANINWQMDQDRKITALKQLQGHMWREGYASGEIHGHVYKDVEEALKLWTSSGKKVYIYSSGSIEAQKLLFGHSVVGNLLQYFSGHFDTTIGLKVQTSSYQEICKSIETPPNEILFLTDIPAEAIAASEVGLQVKLLVRPGNAALSEEILERFHTCRDFQEINLV